MLIKSKKPWPTKAVMQQIYEANLWGKNGDDFYSGEGSHHPNIVVPYVKVVSSFLTSFKNPITICDLGCGDFNIGSQLLSFSKEYFAVDIVPELIEHLKKQYPQKEVSFFCLDIAKDELPKADCVIIRQVLQHLSNKEIKEIVSKLYDYKYVILTEHLPIGKFEANKDIISGQGIRLKKKSGLDITKSPFNFKFKKTVVLNNFDLENNKGKIVTTLFEL
ncbi:class I SAM-dependent methyltransferase [Polaribacter marinivivus]|uniref:Class I SAM-dependent methyltransferase n=1 Tax=Polaribacter marinivivus TaxID=1524260 RepID=A0ABV8R727_9FLAO